MRLYVYLTFVLALLKIGQLLLQIFFFNMAKSFTFKANPLSTFLDQRGHSALFQRENAPQISLGSKFVKLL